MSDSFSLPLAGPVMNGRRRSAIITTDLKAVSVGQLEIFKFDWAISVYNDLRGMSVYACRP